MNTGKSYGTPVAVTAPPVVATEAPVRATANTGSSYRLPIHRPNQETIFIYQPLVASLLASLADARARTKKRKNRKEART